MSRSLPWHEQPVRLVAAAVLAVLIGGLATAGIDGGIFSRYDRAAVDSLYPTGPSDERITVVAIDQASVEAEGPWPWTRAQQADLLDAVSAAGADVIVYDVLAAPPTEGDELLAEAVARSSAEVVLAGLPVGLSLTDDGILAASEIVHPADEISSQAVVAHTLITADTQDGVTRTLPVVVERPDGTLMPSLTLHALAAMEGLDPIPVLRRDGVQVGSRLVPTSVDWRLHLSWPASLSDPNGTRVLSATDLLAGSFDGDLDGRTVLVGVTDQTLGDRHNTPVSDAGGTPGVLVHAAALNTMTTGAFVTTDGPLVGGLVALVLALVAGLSFQVGRAWVGLVVTVVAATAHLVVVAIRFADGTESAVLWPLLGLALGAIGGFCLRYFGEIRQRQRVAALFSRYVPEAAARELMYAEKLQAVMAGQHLEVSVLFCDLRGFTPTAGQLEPDRVRDLLNVYYDRTCRLIADHGGTVLQYVGDEVFAVFGAPLASDDHARRAFDCAVALRAAQDDLAHDLAAEDLPAIHYGIGVHSGPVIAAHVGNQHRQYAVVGETVNIGSRLCSEAREDEVVYSEALRSRMGIDPVGEACGRVPLKGVEGGAVIWRITGDHASAPAVPTAHAEGVPL